MDLIDRDELRMIVYATERCNGKTALIKAFSTLINSAQKVDAIPVEWISNKAKMYEHSDNLLMRDGAFLLNILIDDWKEEQEAQHETV